MTVQKGRNIYYFNRNRQLDSVYNMDIAGDTLPEGAVTETLSDFFRSECDRAYRTYVASLPFSSPYNAGSFRALTHQHTTTPVAGASGAAAASDASGASGPFADVTTAQSDSIKLMLSSPGHSTLPLFNVGKSLPAPTFYEQEVSVLKFLPLRHSPDAQFGPRVTHLIPAASNLIYLKVSCTLQQEKVLDLLWMVNTPPLTYFADVLLQD